ncbi:MAG: GNAT family N-acetyltransferase [Proteobacteria bacterium]|nr:GNAT family N-acetyltransferase [Pseudomonadota bacterium]
MTAPSIREIASGEFDLAWPVFREVIAGGDTYSYPPDLSLADARAMWATSPTRCFVAELDGGVVGIYMLRPNQPGLGDHVANAGYMVAASARGRGVASAMCEHSLAEARRAGFTAMQFNYVVSSNERAVRLWQRHGFAIVGRVPSAFRHATLGSTDVFIMHRVL